MKKNPIIELNINLDNEDSIFKRNYIVPIYQRAYAWQKDEIERLIDDIFNIKEKKYYIGTITVTKRKNQIYELIDGQQRITTLYLLYIYLDLIDKNNIKLSYEIRNDDVFKKLIEEKKKNNDEINNYKEGKKENINIFDGYKNIFNIIKEKSKQENKTTTEIKDKLKNNLKKISLFQIEINLQKKQKNHYFELMNSRGVQLEKTDYIKSRLMKQFEEKDRKKFLAIWNICQDMKTPVNDTKTITNIKEYKSFDDIKINEKTIEERKTIKEIIDNGKKSINKNKKENNIENEAENTTLNFIYFLLYADNLFKNQNEKWDIKENSNNNNNDYNENDAIEIFNKYTKEDTKKFIYFMLNLRKTYDKYIIYRNKDEKWNINIRKLKQKLCMLESCLRVSLTSRKTMHWVYETLGYFYYNKQANIEDYINNMEYYVEKKYIIEYLKEFANNNYTSGFETPRIVLNYLDYLLWNEQPNKDFNFKYRNSIEHFLPRFNDEKNKEEKDQIVNHFGNLCLMGRRDNSKMSNPSPNQKSKKILGSNNKYEQYSLKLILMAEIAQNDDNNSTKWRKNCEKHGIKMLRKLYKKCEENKIQIEDKEKKEDKETKEKIIKYLNIQEH